MSLMRRGALVVRAGPGADDALAEERVLEALVVEVVVEHLGDRGLEDDVDHRLLAVQELLELGADGDSPIQVSRSPVRRRLRISSKRCS